MNFSHFFHWASNYQFKFSLELNQLARPMQVSKGMDDSTFNMANSIAGSK